MPISACSRVSRCSTRAATSGADREPPAGGGGVCAPATTGIVSIAAIKAMEVIDLIVTLPFSLTIANTGPLGPAWGFYGCFSRPGSIVVVIAAAKSAKSKPAK